MQINSRCWHGQSTQLSWLHCYTVTQLASVPPSLTAVELVAVIGGMRIDEDGAVWATVLYHPYVWRSPVSSHACMDSRPGFYAHGAYGFNANLAMASSKMCSGCSSAGSAVSHHQRRQSKMLGRRQRPLSQRVFAWALRKILFMGGDSDAAAGRHSGNASGRWLPAILSGRHPSGRHASARHSDAVASDAQLGGGGNVVFRMASAVAALVHRHPAAALAQPPKGPPTTASASAAAPRLSGGAPEFGDSRSHRHRLLWGLRAMARLPGAVSTAMAAVSSIGGGGSGEAAADAAVRAVADALRPRARLPTLDAGTAGTRVLWQAVLSNYSPSALQQAAAVQAVEEERAGRAPEYEVAAGGVRDRCAPAFVDVHGVALYVYRILHVQRYVCCGVVVLCICR